MLWDTTQSISRRMSTGGPGIRKGSEYDVPLNVDQATATRDALAKALYARVFDYIVQVRSPDLIHLMLTGSQCYHLQRSTARQCVPRCLGHLWFRNT